MELVSKILNAAVIIIVGILILKVFKSLVKKIFKAAETADGKGLSEKRAHTLQSAFSNIIKYLMYFFMVYAALGVFSQGANPMLAVAGAVGVAIGLGAQDLVKDVIAGFFIILEDQYSIGDIVDISSNMGTVEEIGVRTTKVRGFTGELFIIPNGSVSTVVNWAKEFTKASLEVKVSYEDDTQKILDILENEMESAAGAIAGLKNTPVVMGLTELGDYNIKIRIMAQCEAGANWSVERELRLRVKKRFDKEGIKPPYPVTEVVNHKSFGGIYDRK